MLLVSSTCVFHTINAFPSLFLCVSILKKKPKQIELQPCSFMPLPTSQLAVYIHDSGVAHTICREDFERI